MRFYVGLAACAVLLAACILDRQGIGGSVGEGGSGGTPIVQTNGGAGGTGGTGGLAVGGMGGTPSPGCVPQAAARRRITCATRSDGTAWCWGDNDHGAIGNGNVGGEVTVPSQVLNLTDIVEVAVASRMAYARRSDGAVFGWGLNDVGQMGIGLGQLHYPTPVEINTISGINQISAGRGHVCAVNNAGQVYCWGWNSEGQIGDGSYSNSAAPTLVLNDVSRIAAGGRSTCAVRTDDTVWCWGHNDNGEAGQPSGSNITTPMQVNGLLARDVAVGGRHACTRDSAGTVQCWGSNAAMELGSQGPGGHQPQVVPGVVAERIYAAGFRSCARLGDGTLTCWGEPLQLGNNSHDYVPEDSSLPATVGALAAEGNASLALGGQHICGARASGAFVCAGRNNNGQLGDGTDRPHLRYAAAQLPCP